MESADLSDLIPAGYLTDDIMIIDFSESYRVSSPPEDLGIPEYYHPPELVLSEEGKRPTGIACDLWALACTLFEIRSQVPLFYMTRGEDDHLSEMVAIFGKLPEPLWEKWEGREDFMDEDGVLLPGLGHYVEGGRTLTLEVAVDVRSQVEGWGGSEVEKVYTLPVEEQKTFADLLRKMATYDPRKRPSVKEVLKHEWFNM